MRTLTRNTKLIIAAAAAVIAAVVLIIVFSGKKEPEAVSFRKPAPEFDGYGDDDMIPEGVFIGTLYVGGHSRAEAEELVKEVYSGVENREVTIYWDGDPIMTSLEAFDVEWGVDEALDTAIRISRSHGLLSSYRNTMDLRIGTYHMELAKKVNREKIDRFVEEVAYDHDIRPVNAKIEMDRPGNFVVTEEKNGTKTDLKQTADKIVNSFINNDAEDMLTVIATVNEVKPEITAEMLRNVGDVLGQASTIYHEAGSEYGSRSNNVEVATAFISGTVLMPGKQVSTSELMRERTQENGYQTGSQMHNGQMEDAIGGGVCQVASTLYNALLKSELQIDRRSNHSMLIKYLPPSKDAAIATGSKDLIFTNSLEYPIYIKGDTDGTNVIFTIYGKETRPQNRTIEFVSVEDSRVVPEDIVVYDDTMPEGRIKVTGSHHDEVYSHLEKVVYINGMEVSRETLHSDHYQPSVITETIGTKPTGAADDE